MASNIVLKTYAAGDNNQGSVTPQNDALVYQAAIPTNGIFNGATVTLSSANVLHVAAGFGIMGGRFFEVLENDISVQLSASGELLGRLYIHLDLGNADNPISIESYTGASLPALQGDPNLNLDDGVFDMELCTFSINELTISNIVNTFPTLKAANNQLRRATAYSVGAMVFCQSAADNLVFVCTTAGTTAVQQPMEYATITNGNTITDGTAVFKAVDLIAAINEVNTKLSKTEVLISNSGDAYSPSKPYQVGELCIYNNTLYRCTTACSAGSWSINQSCFTADTLTNVTSKVNADLPSKANRELYMKQLWSSIAVGISISLGSIINHDGYLVVRAMFPNAGSADCIIPLSVLRLSHDYTLHFVISNNQPSNGNFYAMADVSYDNGTLTFGNVNKGSSVGTPVLVISECSDINP